MNIIKWYSVVYLSLGVEKKRCCIALCDWPKKLENYSRLLKKVFLENKCLMNIKICIKAFKTWEISAQRGEKKFKKKKISDRPTHVLAPRGQYNIFLL